VCRGEGDEALIEFLDVLAAGGDITGVRNFWVKADGKVHRNECRPLIEDLDLLPLPDYGLFDYEQLPEYAVNRSLVVAASRGCVFNCTYCCNHALRGLYPNRGKYLRYTSPARTVARIREGLALFGGIERVRFVDDTLSYDPDWFREFSQLYKDGVGLSYSTNDRCTSITEQVADLYADSGCSSIDLGIESGNERIRNEVMNRRMSDAQIRQAFETLKARGINVNAFNVLGMPGETMATLIDTLKLNAQVRPLMTYNAFFQPFPRTRAREQCQELGLPMEEEFPPGFAIRPVVRLDTVSADELMVVAKFFRVLLKLYQLSFSRKKRSRLAKCLERALDGALLRGWVPFRLLNRIVPGQAAFRLKHPRISRMVTSAVRKFRLLTKSGKRY